ncbi:MAG: hypothetical protein ACKPH3_00905 [Dolichospermum sp.]
MLVYFILDFSNGDFREILDSFFRFYYSSLGFMPFARNCASNFSILCCSCASNNSAPSALKEQREQNYY